MSSARYVGRVGALAVALGIGAVIAGVPGVAWADTQGEPDPSDAPGVSEPKNPDSSAGDPSDTEVRRGDVNPATRVGRLGDSGDVEGADDSEGGMQVGNSGGPNHVDVAGQCGCEIQAEGRGRRSAEEAIGLEAEGRVCGAAVDHDDNPVDGEDGDRYEP